MRDLPAGMPLTRSRNRKTLARIVLAVTLFWMVAGSLLGPTVVRKIGKAWLADKCLKRGGCWNAGDNRCETEDKWKCTVR